MAPQRGKRARLDSDTDDSDFDEEIERPDFQPVEEQPAPVQEINEEELIEDEEDRARLDSMAQVDRIEELDRRYTKRRLDLEAQREAVLGTTRTEKASEPVEQQGRSTRATNWRDLLRKRREQPVEPTELQVEEAEYLSEGEAGDEPLTLATLAAATIGRAELLKHVGKYYDKALVGMFVRYVAFRKPGTDITYYSIARIKAIVDKEGKQRQRSRSQEELDVKRWRIVTEEMLRKRNNTLVPLEIGLDKVSDTTDASKAEFAKWMAMRRADDIEVPTDAHVADSAGAVEMLRKGKHKELAARAGTRMILPTDPGMRREVLGMHIAVLEAEKAARGPDFTKEANLQELLAERRKLTQRTPRTTQRRGVRPDYEIVGIHNSRLLAAHTGADSKAFKRRQQFLGEYERMGKSSSQSAEAEAPSPAAAKSLVRIDHAAEGAPVGGMPLGNMLSMMDRLVETLGG